MAAASPKPGADRPIDGFLERDAELPRAPSQESRQIVIECKGRSHAGKLDASFLTSTHHAPDITGATSTSTSSRWLPDDTIMLSIGEASE